MAEKRTPDILNAIRSLHARLDKLEKFGLTVNFDENPDPGHEDAVNPGTRVTQARNPDYPPVKMRDFLLHFRVRHGRTLSAEHVFVDKSSSHLVTIKKKPFEIMHEGYQTSVVRDLDLTVDLLDDADKDMKVLLRGHYYDSRGNFQDVRQRVYYYNLLQRIVEIVMGSRIVRN